ncbi:hypothetical protein N7471_013642 [Penicillium samsonianum]|uniref:uncharacterized protein n=1 Tax=Penicillium samsonianum TaxID=1882272 RepID=UPI002547E935|nr:uncharacterized protein N7471_013642 [Penicillium samsonianum]KAJ6119022.1 hypothetical protein N7471_013642 [Penicillium samsonianum]
MLTLTLNPPTKYKPGDSVTGDVRYNPKRNARFLSYPIRLLVQLIGNTETKVESHSGHATFLRFTAINLYLSHREHICPFSFPFPNILATADTDADSHPPTVQMQNMQPGAKQHTLPPSFTEVMGGVVSEGTVEYAVTASIWIQYDSSIGKSTRICEEKVSITFEPRYSGLDLKIIQKMRPSIAVRRDCVVRSLMLLPKHSRHISSEKKDQTGLQVVPHFDFQIFLDTPTYGYLGGSRECLVNILPAPRTSTAPSIPEFWARRYRVHLVGFTSLFAPSSKSRGDHTVKNENVVFDIENRNWGVLLSNGNGYTTWIKVVIPADERIAPAFTSFNIERMYYLHVEVWVECAGEEFYVRSKNCFRLMPVFSRVSSIVPEKGEDSLRDSKAVLGKGDRGCDDAALSQITWPGAANETNLHLK